ncbi:MAG: hypothetical protein IH845_04120 [Nanoarchaeota archaeon]|nr:hypothetical protein [Nanoarchaeota archaeon]
MKIKKLVLESQKDLNILRITKDYIVVKAKYGPSKETRIPLTLSKDLSIFVSMIIGDGHLKKSKKQITIELSDKKLIEYFKKICFKIFNREFNINPVKPRPNKKQSWHIPIDSKAIYNLLNQVFEVPIGKKSHTVKVPKIIKSSKKEFKRAFLQGIMLTEGGKRRRGYGLSTASKTLWEDLQILFENIGIPIKNDKWLYKKYKKEYYGLVFKKDFYPILMRGCRSGQTGCA